MRVHAPSFVAPPRWAVQPTLSAAPGLWRGALSLISFSHAGELWDAARRVVVERQSGSGGGALPGWVFGPRGQALRCDSSIGRAGNADHSVEGIDYGSLTINIPSGSDFTFVFSGVINAINGSNGGFFRSIGTEDADGDSFCIFTGSQPRPWIRWGGTDVLKNSTADRFSLGQFVTLAFVVRSARSAEFWAGEELADSASHSKATPSHSYRFVGHQFGEVDWIGADYSVVGFWQRALDSTEIRAIARDPYIMFRPARRVLIATSGGTPLSADIGAGTFTLSGLAQQVSAGQSNSVGAGVLNITGAQAQAASGQSIGLSPGLLMIQGQAISVQTGSSVPVAVEIGPGSLSLATAALAAQAGVSVDSGAGVVNLTGQPLTISAGAVGIVGPATLTISGRALSIESGASVSVDIGTGTLTLSGMTLSQVAGLEAAIAAGLLSFDGQALVFDSGESIQINSARLVTVHGSVRLAAIHEFDRVMKVIH